MEGKWGEGWRFVEASQLPRGMPPAPDRGRRWVGVQKWGGGAARDGLGGCQAFLGVGVASGGGKQQDVAGGPTDSAGETLEVGAVL